MGLITRLVGPLGLLYYTGIAVYRLFFHPLASVPGPKLAALTSWYEIYWDIFKEGQYMWQIDAMHDKYGPVVRVNPREVHIRDRNYWDFLYSNSARLDKDHIHYRGLGSNTTMFATTESNFHRVRRGAASKMFSPANIAKLEPRIRAQIQRLFERIDAIGKSGQILPWTDASKALTMDVISAYSEPRPARAFLDSPDFAHQWHMVVRRSVLAFIIERHFPVYYFILSLIPRWYLQKTDPDVLQLLDKKADLLEQTQRVLASQDKMTEDKSLTVLETLVTSKTLPLSEKSPRRLTEEIESILNAGTETLATVLTTMVFYVLDKPEILARLKTEVTSCSQSPKDVVLDSATLVKLPYLAAVINESLRVASPVTGRLTRFHPSRVFTYTNKDTGVTHTFPPHTSMSMSPRDVMADPEVFPNPTEFKPERWLDSSSDQSSTTTPEQRKLMHKCLVPFSTGHRNCIGLELAKQEILLTAGNLFRRFDFELYDTSERDISHAHDYFAPFPAADTQGVRLKVKV
ncbi:putative cytochrome P450 [Saccharata proteae CBS 121410]|uniref:Cytochrome P450 n=1 Tax=Saccharata proteae CBS 121410 TaxID=1314787 RepID=A0A9P4HYP0_9PEZI|nr:putative cytochrome P450 [Saccharata proteae CBS 121410]